jgi:hypothetical protein
LSPIDNLTISRRGLNGTTGQGGPWALRPTDTVGLYSVRWSVIRIKLVSVTMLC